MCNFRSSFITLVLGLTALTPFAQAVPATINYQGRLTDNGPTPAPVNATVNMTFEIWDVPAGGTAGINRLWLEPASGATPIVVTTGIFNALLGASAGGSSVPIPASLFNGGTARYLQIIVNGETLTPRQRISATGYANQAQNAALAATATTATTATNATQLGGVAAGNWQRSLSAVNCGTGQFYTAIAQNGTASCAGVSNSSITPPLVLSGIGSVIISGSNDDVGNGIAGTASEGYGGYFTNTGGGTALYSNGRLEVVSSHPGDSDTARFRAAGLGGNDSHIHFGATGDWYIRSALNTGKIVLQDTGGQVTIGTTVPVAGKLLTVDGDVSLGRAYFTSTANITGAANLFNSANFGTTTRQMLNLWGTPDGNNTADYGIGVQSYTQYFRSGAGGGGFAWYSGGTHSNAQSDPGAGGTKLMTLSGAGDNLSVGGNITQPYYAAGAVKAMVAVLPNGSIVRCYNGGLPGGPTSTIPCGMTVSKAGPGLYDVDFGFRVDNRFVNMSTSSVNRSLSYLVNTPPSNIMSFVTVVAGISSFSDTDFMAFIY